MATWSPPTVNARHPSAISVIGIGPTVIEAGIAASRTVPSMHWNTARRGRWFTRRDPLTPIDVLPLAPARQIESEEFANQLRQRELVCVHWQGASVLELTYDHERGALQVATASLRATVALADADLGANLEAQAALESTQVAAQVSGQHVELRFWSQSWFFTCPISALATALPD